MKQSSRRYPVLYGVLFIVFIGLMAGCSVQPKAFIPSHEIHVVSREDGSGTRGAFTELTGIASKNEAGEVYDYTTREAIITNSTAVVMTTVAEDPHAIGYLSLGSMNDSVKGLTINGIPPTAEKIKAGKYPIARPFLLATKGEQNEIVEDFLRFITSTEGQTIVEEMGYVSVGATGPYPDNYLSGKIVVGGSSSVTPVMEKLKEGYQHLQPDIVIEVQQSDSTTGMASVVEENYDIGMASRSLKESEISQGLEEQTIAMDGIVIIVSPKNPLVDVSLSLVDDIFTGEVSSWEELEHPESLKERSQK